MGGMRVVPDLPLTELEPSHSAMFIASGADAWDAGLLTPFAAKAREFLEAGVPVAAICGTTGGCRTRGVGCRR